MSLSRAFYDFKSEGLSRSKVLPLSDEFDVATCATLADVDFDGNLEVIIGTYGEQILAYKEIIDDETRKWQLLWRTTLHNPIHNIFHTDLTGDGIKDLFVITLKSVIVLQHDYDSVKELLKQRSLTNET